MMVFFQLFIHFWRNIGLFYHKNGHVSALIRNIAACMGIFIAFPGYSLATSNYYIESQIAADIKTIAPPKSIVLLKTSEKTDILALFSESKIADLQGGAIILSDLYQTPDWPIIVHNLRTKLPEFGWETLSVQLPVPVTDPGKEQMDHTYELTKQRIEAAIAFFQKKNISNIVLIGIRQSANFALKFARQLPEESNDIQSLITISAYDSKWLTSSELIKNIPLTMLDIFAEHDLDIVLESAAKRLVAANFAGKLKAKPRFLKLSSKVQNLAINKTGNLRYRQKVINGADYQFDEEEQQLIKAIRGWLAVYVAGQEITVQ